jgi:AmmeMemoRadiSam system protein B/AmmeMemoRadiSam system protein A
MSIRPAAVAGSFYPGSATSLRTEVRTHLRDAGESKTETSPKAVIVPHAGYIYSGPVAACAYATLAGLHGQIRRVVLLGPAHRVSVRGLALPGVDAFETPLGSVTIDPAAARLVTLPQVVVHAGAHAHEHSLEVQLPFLQETLGEFALVPLVVGDASPDEVAEVLQAVWGGPETLIVISSDLSHYLPYELARRADSITAQAIADLDPTLTHSQACGATPVNGLLSIARRFRLQAELLDLRNSGDTAGERARVVGYGAWAFYEMPRTGQADDEQTEIASDARNSKHTTLLSVARGAIAGQLGIAVTPPATAAFLNAHGASFVTLRHLRELRGCIGSLDAHRPLGEDVQYNARAAAFADPRFEPLTRHEYEQVRIEVSVLSTPQPMSARSLVDLQAQLRPHVDGLILRFGEKRATFLPKVWEVLPNAHDFIAHLQHKAGLPVGFWHEELHVARYAVESFAEAED